MQDRIQCFSNKYHFHLAQYAKIGFEEGSANISLYLIANQHEATKEPRFKSIRRTVKMGKWI